jgi:hypothetical protein
MVGGGVTVVEGCIPLPATESVICAEVVCTKMLNSIKKKMRLLKNFFML